MSDRRWAHVRRLILSLFFSFFFVFFVVFFFFKVFRRAPCIAYDWHLSFWERDIGPRPCFRDEPVFYPTFVSRARIIIRPVVVVVVVEGDARRIFVATTISFAACGTKDSSVSHTTVIVRLFCPADGHDDLVESSHRGIRPDVWVRQIFPLLWHLFRVVCRTGNDETPRGVLVISTGYFALAIVGLMLDNRRGAMTRACNCNGVAVYIRTTWSVFILPVFPAGLSGLIGSSKCLRQVPLHTRVHSRLRPRTRT